MIRKRNIDNDIHEFVTKGLDGGWKPDGKFVPSDKLKSNPIWIALGGENYIKGLSMDPGKRASTTKWNEMIDHGQQANKLKEAAPREGKSEEIFKLHKACKEGK
jgi:hypothetical protein